MTTYSVCRFGSAWLLPAALAALLLVPHSASASVGQQCSGEPVTGQGASLVKIAEQNVWGPDFNSSSNAAACSGTQGSAGTPKVSYSSTSSGAGLESWGANKHSSPSFGGTNAFVGTEEAPNPTQKSEIEASGAPGTLLSIPVLQSAITIDVHLPAGCAATSTEAPGRLVLKNATLQNIFVGKTTEWKQIKDGGDKFLNAKGIAGECAIIVKSAKVTFSRVVRSDSAGTTAILKKYLFLISKKAVDGTLTWDEIAEASNNTLWPNESTVIRAKGDSGLASEVAKDPSSIGYVSLADARANGSFAPGTGGPGTSTFWVELEHGKGVYADPASNEDVAAKANSNCESTIYTNGKKKFPPPTSQEPWNEVTSSVKEKNYTLCGFAFALAFDGYHDFPGTTEAEATTVQNYLLYTLNAAAGGGQQEIVGNDYLPLPTSATESQNVLKIAQEGAALVTF